MTMLWRSSGSSPQRRPNHLQASLTSLRWKQPTMSLFFRGWMMGKHDRTQMVFDIVKCIYRLLYISQTFVALVFLANCLACAQPSTSIVRKLIELYNLIMEPELNFNLITSFRQLTMHYRTKYAHRSIYWYVDDMGDIMQVGTFASETGVEYQE